MLVCIQLQTRIMDKHDPKLNFGSYLWVRKRQLWCLRISRKAEASWKFEFFLPYQFFYARVCVCV